MDWTAGWQPHKCLRLKLMQLIAPIGKLHYEATWGKVTRCQLTRPSLEPRETFIFPRLNQVSRHVTSRPPRSVTTRHSHSSSGPETAVRVDLARRRPSDGATPRQPSIAVHKPTLEIELANYRADRPAAPLPPNPISANKWRLILICVRGGAAAATARRQRRQRAAADDGQRRRRSWRGRDDKWRDDAYSDGWWSPWPVSSSAPPGSPRSRRLVLVSFSERGCCARRWPVVAQWR